MNEVTQIHLGRQSYTIAADAHTALRTYLNAIREEAGAGVADEVELRMAELLTERGVTADKVVLLADVDTLKAQLGVPEDFKDETAASSEKDAAEAPAKTPAKRLFRDTQNGIVAGVASGLGAFVGIDAWFVRILFIITTLAWGWGALLYLALWLLVPEAKTSSDRLQMQGKAVTVHTLKQAIEDADMPGTAERFARKASPVLNGVFYTVVKIIGVVVLLASLLFIFGLITGSVYIALHHGQIMAENFFPIGTAEHLAVIVLLAWCALLALLMVLTGVAMIRRRWPTAPWATGVLLSLLFVGLAACISLGADIAPRVYSRVEAARHTTTMPVASFSNLAINGHTDVVVEHATTYQVAISYIGNPDLSKLSVQSSGGTLTIDSSHLKTRSDCTMICIFPNYDLKITVYTPVAPQILNSRVLLKGYTYPQLDKPPMVP